MSEGDLRKQLHELEESLKKQLDRGEIDPDEAVDMYLEKQADTEARIEMLKRQDSRYRRKLFEENIKAFQALEAGLVGKTRLDIQNMTLKEVMLENAKDLRRVRGAVTGWKHMKTNEETFLNAVVKLLLVVVRQNQILIQKMTETTQRQTP